MSLDENMTAGQETLSQTLPILRNAFHVLGVAPRDNRQRIVEAADERSLAFDADVCAKARADLTNPRNRLSAELAWLPGMSPQRAQQLIDGLAANPAAVFRAEDVPPLAHANLMASAVLALDPALPEVAWVVSIIAFGKAVETIAAETVLAEINEDRIVAGFTDVKSVEAIAEGLRERRREYRECLRNALDTLPSQKLAAVATEVAEIATDHGRAHPPILIDDMIDAYAVGAHGFLAKEAENVRLLIEQARRAAPAGAAAVDSVLARLEKVVRNWCVIAKPIQLAAAAKGTAHGLSHEVAGAVRMLGVSLYNDHTMLEASQRLVQLLQDAFEGLSELVDRVGDDARALDDLARRKRNEEKTKPLHDLCLAAIAAIERDPHAGASQGRKVLDTGKPLIAALAQGGLDRDSIAELQDVVAITLFRCAIVVGNASKWETAIDLLEAARPLAHGKELLDRIETSLVTARKNQRVFGNLQPISSAPGMFTLNGFGCMVYGNSDPDPESGSYMTTYYFVFLFIPIFPICRYRVISSGNSYRFLGKAPLRTFDKWHLAISVTIALGLVLAMASR